MGCSARSAVTRKARGLTVCVVHERFFKLTRDDVDHGDDEDPGERDEGCQEVVVNHLAALQRNSRAVIRNFKPETQAKEGAWMRFTWTGKLTMKKMIATMTH